MGMEGRKREEKGEEEKRGKRKEGKGRGAKGRGPLLFCYTLSHYILDKGMNITSVTLRMFQPHIYTSDGRRHVPLCRIS